MWNNLELEQWITDSFENLTAAQTSAINAKYGKVNASRLVAGKIKNWIINNQSLQSVILVTI